MLRKLRIPLRQIADILKSEDTAVAINAFNQNLSEIEDEITALTMIKSVVQTLINRLHLHSDTLRLLDDESLLELVDSLTVTKINFKEEKTMEDLNKASEELLKMKDSDVRIIYLPPMCIASYLASGEDCEGKATDEIGKFVKANNLTEVKPDLRCFGFDCSRGEPRCTGKEYNPGQGFEEILNYRSFILNGGNMQLDLLFPIKEK